MIRNGVAIALFLGISFAAQAQSLDGVWEISSVVDNGRVVSPTEIRTSYAADGRVTINGQVAEFVVPMTYQRKKLPFAVDATRSPARLDLAGAEKTGGRGILLPGKDSMILCLSGRDKPRPTAFAPGPDILFISLQRATGDAATAQVPNQPPTYSDDQLRQMLVGTWGHQDEETIHYITLNQNGSMSTIMQWKDQFKKMFHQDVRSDGSWKLQDGVVLVKIDNSSDKERKGQLFSFRIRSITSTELVAVDALGTVRQEWKAQ